MFKKILIVFLLAALLGAIFISFNFEKALKFTIRQVCQNTFGAKVKIDNLSLDTSQKVISIENARIYNPAGFGDEPLIDIERLVVDYDLSEIFKSKIKLNLVVFQVRSCTIIKNSRGELNIDSLKNVRKRRKILESGKDISKRFLTEIEIFSLSLNRVISKIYRANSNRPKVKIYNVEIKNKIYKDVPGARQLVFLILAESVKHTAISRAEFYTIEMLGNVSFFPAGLANMITGKDNVKASFAVSYDMAYNSVMDVLNRLGVVTLNEKNLIKARLKHYHMAVKLKETPEGEVQITVYARKILFGRPVYARAVLYQISEELNK